MQHLKQNDTHKTRAKKIHGADGARHIVVQTHNPGQNATNDSNPSPQPCNSLQQNKTEKEPFINSKTPRLSEMQNLIPRIGTKP